MNEQQAEQLIEEIKQNERKKERILWMSRIAKEFREEEGRRRRESQNLKWFAISSFVLGSAFYLLFKK